MMLEGLVKSKVNMLISGGTGAGKTTLLNILSGYIPETERIVTIEDAAELQLQQPHVVRLETRPPNIEGKGEITQRALVRNALRMRPDRIVIGEVRGAEAFDMLQAMNTGHEGSLTTIHANTPRDALSRLENMIGMAGLNLPHKAARQQIASAITVVIQVLRLIDGQRKVTSIQEITGMEGDVITMQEIFAFRQTGVEAGRQGNGPLPGDRHAAEIRGQAAQSGHRSPRLDVRPQQAVRVSRAIMDLVNNSFFPLFALLAFVAVVLLFEALYMIWNSYKGPEAKKIEQRLRALSASSDTSARAAVLKNRMLSEVPAIDRLLLAMPRAHTLDRLLLQSGLDWTVAKLLFMSIVSGVVYFALSFVNVLPLLHLCGGRGRLSAFRLCAVEARQALQPASRMPVKLEVANGNGVAGLAKRTSSSLQRKGYLIARLTNQLPYNQKTTEIQYRRGQESQARELNALLPVRATVVESSLLGATVNVRIVLGHDFSRDDMQSASSSPQPLIANEEKPAATRG